MFNRVDAIKKAIQAKSIDDATIAMIVDMHLTKGNITQEENDMLMGMLFPEEV